MVGFIWVCVMFFKDTIVVLQAYDRTAAEAFLQRSHHLSDTPDSLARVSLQAPDVELWRSCLKQK